IPIKETETINIFPNPVENELFIRSEQQIEKVVILDISGRVVVSTGLTTVGVTEHSQSINVSHLPKGLYFVKIFAGNQSITNKIIKK
ncbi:MAG: T9SS type A sorting domain-containing protein, partial [Tannerella sp.]|nr:T9SS type A sorting domain-containing protein [Tannerella sp.]